MHFIIEEACVAEWLTPQTPDLGVRGSSITHHIVSLDKELYSSLSVFIQVYKWVLQPTALGGNPVMDYSCSILSRGEKQYS